MRRPQPRAPDQPFALALPLLAPPPTPCPRSCTDCLLYRTPSLLYLYQSHWPWTPPISARHYATTTSTTSTTTSTTTTQNSDRSAYRNPRKVAAKVVVKKKNGKSPWEPTTYSWRAKIFFFFFVRAKSITQREFSSFSFFSSVFFCVPFFTLRCICDKVYDLNSFPFFFFFLLFSSSPIFFPAFRFRSVSVSAFLSRGCDSWRAFCRKKYILMHGEHSSFVWYFQMT